MEEHSFKGRASPLFASTVEHTAENNSHPPSCIPSLGSNSEVMPSAASNPSSDQQLAGEGAFHANREPSFIRIPISGFSGGGHELAPTSGSYSSAAPISVCVTKSSFSAVSGSYSDSAPSSGFVDASRPRSSNVHASGSGVVSVSRSGSSWNSGSGSESAHRSGTMPENPSGPLVLGSRSDSLSESRSEARSEALPDSRSDTQSQSCLLYTSPSPRDLSTSRMPSSA